MKEGNLKLILKLLKYLIEKIYLSFNDNLVYYDSVTRCKSRFYYDAIIRIKYENVECRIVYIDINDLKQVNDNLGHCMGTQYIKCIADQLLELPRVRHVCRIGGDEFALICTTDFDEKELSRIKGISYGLVHKFKDEPFDDIVRKADTKMYEMKKAMKKGS